MCITFFSHFAGYQTFKFPQTPLCNSMVLIMSLELVAVSAAAHLTDVVIYVVCLAMGMRREQKIWRF